jgi:hypothetical protein
MRTFQELKERDFHRMFNLESGRETSKRMNDQNKNNKLGMVSQK